MKSKPNIKSLWLLLQYLRPYRLQILAATVALVFTSSAVLGMGAALRYLVDEGLSKGNTELLDRGFFILLGVVGLLALASYTRYYLVSWIGERVVADIRNDVYRHLLTMHMGFFEKARTGDLLSRLTTDTTLLQALIGSSISVAMRNTLMFFGGIILLLVTSTQLTFYVALMLPFVVLPIILLGRRVRSLGRELQDKIGEVNTHAEETLSAIRTVQALALENYETRQFADRIDSAFGVSVSRISQRARLTAIVIALVFGAVVTVLWFGGRDVLAGHISAGDLSAFVFYSVVVAGAVGALSEVMADLQRAAGASERISELLSLEPEIYSAEAEKGTTVSLSGEVVFERVSFTYPARPEKSAISDFSLRIAAGSTVALVGPSGAGKSTIFQLLLRFYDPDSGSISVNGHDIRQMDLQALRAQIGLVPQDPVIFSGTARDNIRLGKLDATDDEILQAAETASALEFIQKLPQGLNTHLGEKGVQLSGGQKQRIAIARAVIQNPRILMLDEATSALDSENERHIQQALTRIMGGRTTFVIAHRLSTIVKADQIVLLNEGKIEMIGTHEELLSASPLYARLAELQFKSAA